MILQAIRASNWGFNTFAMGNFFPVVKQILVLSGCSKLGNLPEELYRVQTLVELHVDGTALYELPASTMSLTNLRELSLGRCAGIPFNLWNSILWPLSLLRLTQRPMALVVPSLSCLHMLKTVDVSHCNLSGPSLNNIVQLSLLEDLNLSGTDIFMLPTNFCQLSHLKRLGLVGCKCLQALPQLPSSILKGLFSMLLPQGNLESYGNRSMLLEGSLVPNVHST